MTQSLVGRIVAIVVLCIVAYVASAFLPSPIGWIVALLCGLGVLIVVLYLVLDLIR